ncbi:MAG: hypothetical protein ACE5IR_21985 [bacterium]
MLGFNMKWVPALVVVAFAIVGGLIITWLIQRAMDKESDDFPPEIVAEAKIERVRRAEVQSKYPELFADLQQCLFKHDPIGINFESNTDEYAPEVGTIVPRLSACSSQADVFDVVYEEFVKWFGADVAGPKSRYEKVSEEIWMIWQERKTQPASPPNPQ